MINPIQGVGGCAARGLGGPPTAAKHAIWGSAFISRFAALVFTKWFGNMEILGARTDTLS